MLKAVFFSKAPYNSRIEVYVGKVTNEAQSSHIMFEPIEDPEAISMFTLSMRFTHNLVKALEVPGIRTCHDMMNNIPLCLAHNNKLKKIFWEELHAKPTEEN